MNLRFGADRLEGLVVLVAGLRVSVELVMCLDVLIVWRRQRSSCRQNGDVLTKRQ
jgi:hypothetical protein